MTAYLSEVVLPVRNPDTGEIHEETYQLKDIEAQLHNLDDVPTQGSNNVVKSGGVYLAEVPKTDVAPIENDNTASRGYAIGEQFYRNNVLYKAKAPIASGTAWSSLTLDTDYEAADNVSSQIQAIENETEDMANMYAPKNRLQYTLVSGSNNEVNYTVNADKTISITTTGTVERARFINLNADFSFLEDGETYILNGCPSGGSVGSSYLLYILENNSEEYLDTGNGVQFTYDSSKEYLLRLVVYPGVSISTAIVFKPMIRSVYITDSTYESFCMTNQELTQYAASQSNPNLLDNPWFTVNQRGKSSYATNATYTVDRWAIAQNNSDLGSVTVNPNGSIILENVNGTDAFYLRQSNLYSTGNPFENILGKKVTLSVMLGTGSIVYGSGDVPSAPSDWTKYITVMVGQSAKVVLQAKDGKVLITFELAKGAPAVTIRAVKLELGLVSTLVNDIAPNYQQELAKCQRYFQRIALTDYWQRGGAVMGIVVSGKTARIPIEHVTEMRAIPTLSFNDVSNFVVAEGYYSTKQVLTSLTWFSGSLQRSILVANWADNKTTGIPVFLGLNESATDYLDFSADL